MTLPVTYVEIHSPELQETERFLAATFGWEPQAFVTADYLVAPHGDGPGVDAGLLASRDGQPRTVPVVRVDDMGEAIERVRANGGQVVVEPFSIAGVGHGCYVTDPAGVLVGLHAYDPDA